jgi:hypothetical protein
MKKTMILMSILFTAISLNAQTGPQIEPGPVQTLSEQSIEAVEVLLKVDTKDVATFRKSGNVMKAITFQALAPGKSEYTYTIQHCMIGGFAGGHCLGGAQLQVLVETESGNMPTEKITSRVVLIK